jgi:hypothetical protein
MRDRLTPRAQDRTAVPEKEPEPAPPAPDDLVRLQSTVGNRAVAAMIARWPFGGPVLAGPAAATHAKTSPAAEYSGILHREVDLLANAKAIVAFLRAKRGTPTAGAAVTVTAAEIVADAALAKKLKPKPKTDADVQPTLDLLVYYGVLAAQSGGYAGVVDPKTNDLDTARLDNASGEITALTKEFDARAAKKDSVDPISMTELLDPSMAAGSRDEKKADTDAQAAVADVEGQLSEHVVLRSPDGKGKARAPIARVTVAALPPAAPNAKGVDVIALPVAGKSKAVEVPADEIAGIEPVASGASPDTAKLRTGIEAKLEKARKRLARAQGYRTFAVEVVDFLERLRTRNTTWLAGTYPSHSWGEFSIDIFLNVGEDKQGFYRVDPTETFFDDLNDTALEDGPWGTFQWRAVYNDDRMIATVGGKYGTNRISKAPHHGPAPDKLHIHLDVRPDKLQPDATTGFRVNSSGRVDPF